MLARYIDPPMNYFCAEAAGELAGLIEAWSAPEIRAIVLTGDIGGPFITHYSVDELASFVGNRDEMAKTGTGLSDGYHSLLGTLRALPKPVIAAINGDCMGGGLELALWCDFRIMADGDHRIGLPEINMGIMPGGSGTQMLARLIGSARALDLILNGRIVTPSAALDLGIVNEVVGDAVTRALEIASRLASKNPIGVTMIKQAVFSGIDLPLAEGLGIEARAFLDVAASSTAVHSMNAYLAVPLDDRRAWLERQVIGR